jgi:hypothetical protein
MLDAWRMRRQAGRLKRNHAFAAAVQSLQYALMHPSDNETFLHDAEHQCEAASAETGIDMRLVVIAARTMAEENAGTRF